MMKITYYLGMNSLLGSYKAMMSIMLLSVMFLLAGCESTGVKSASVGPSVGPGSNKALGDKTRTYTYKSDIHLDVAVPVFDPGLPADDDELIEDNIWPQLRRAESNRFALLTKQALEKTGAFGNVSVVPTPDATADLYVLGRIEQSNSEDIEIVIDIVDISGKRWDSKKFEHRVSLGFFRDRKNKSKDPYSKVFTKVADHVFNLLSQQTEQQKADLKQLTDIRFAQSFSPEAFSQHVAKNGKGQLSLVSLPSQEDAMLNRIKTLRVKDQMFIDDIQDQYEKFSAKTDESYRIWQETTLPNAIKAREAKNEAMVKGVVGGVLAVASIFGGSRPDLNNTEKVVTGVSALATAYFIKESFGKSAEAKEHQAKLDEAGLQLDIEMDDHVMSVENETIKLTGTSEEQYTQWKAELKKMYELEFTPAVQL